MMAPKRTFVVTASVEVFYQALVVASSPEEAESLFPQLQDHDFAEGDSGAMNFVECHEE